MNRTEWAIGAAHVKLDQCVQFSFHFFRAYLSRTVTHLNITERQKLWLLMRASHNSGLPAEAFQSKNNYLSPFDSCLRVALHSGKAGILWKC